MKKRILSVLLSMTMVVTLVTGCGSSSSNDKKGETDEIKVEIGENAPACKDALKGVKLNVGTSGTYAPFSFFAEDGTTLQGFDVDFIKALQEILGFEISNDTIQDMDYPALVPSITGGKLDVGAAALCATDERKKSMNFSNTYYDAGLKVIVAKDNDEIKSVEDLKSGNYKVAIHSGTLANEYAEQNLPADCIQLYDSIALAYKAVEGGQADATIYDVPGTAYAISTGQIKLKMVGDEFFTGQAPYALAVSFDACKKYPELLDDLNAAIEYLNESGTMDKIIAKWCE